MPYMSDNDTPEDPGSGAGADSGDDGPDRQEVEALIDPEEGTAAGGTARADATFGADAVDEALGDDAPERVERRDARSGPAPGTDADDERREVIRRRAARVARAYGQPPREQDHALSEDESWPQGPPSDYDEDA